jgi:tetratricopeptide (TPR) repeat protein
MRYALQSHGVRPCNYIDWPIERSDRYFSYLTQLYFFNHKAFAQLSKKCTPLLKKPSNELGWALRGYFSYLKEDYKDAADAFLEAIALAPENLDNWLDYAFALRHLGDEKASLKILFETKTVIKRMLKIPKALRIKRFKTYFKTYFNACST